MKLIKRHVILGALVAIFLCTPAIGETAIFTPKAGGDSELQQRIFDNASSKQLMQASVQTLQDLNFGIREMDVSSGVLTALFTEERTKFSLTISIFQHPEKDSYGIRVLLSTNEARTDKTLKPKDGYLGRFYQQFFQRIEQQMFTTRNRP